VSKYLSHQTTVAIKKNETAMHTYPSLTFCPGFKNGSNAVDALEKATIGTI